MNGEKLQWIVMGVFYGYPDCCIEYFCTRKNNSRTLMQLVIGTSEGFIPCPECAYKIFNYAVDNDKPLVTNEDRILVTKSIISNRYCPEEFPKEEDHEDETAS